MINRIRIIAILVILSFAVTAFAASKGNEGKGRFYFRQECKTCHTKGAAGGEVTPLSKNMDQWRTYFVTGKHQHGKEALSKTMVPAQLVDVQAFLVSHAADSLQPETCGK